MREQIKQRDIEKSPDNPADKIIFDLNAWNFVKLVETEKEGFNQGNLKKVYHDILTETVAGFEHEMRPLVFGAVRCEENGVHAPDGVRLVQFGSGAFSLNEEAKVQGHDEEQPIGTVVVRCVLWDRVIGAGWQGWFQPPRNYSEDKKLLFRLDDVLGSGLTMEKATDEGNNGKDPPPKRFLE